MPVSYSQTKIPDNMTAALPGKPLTWSPDTKLPPTSGPLAKRAAHHRRSTSCTIEHRSLFTHGNVRQDEPEPEIPHHGHCCRCSSQSSHSGWHGWNCCRLDGHLHSPHRRDQGTNESSGRTSLVIAYVCPPSRVKRMCRQCFGTEIPLWK